MEETRDFIEAARHVLERRELHDQMTDEGAPENPEGAPAGAASASEAAPKATPAMSWLHDCRDGREVRLTTDSCGKCRLLRPGSAGTSYDSAQPAAGPAPGRWLTGQTDGAGAPLRWRCDPCRQDYRHAVAVCEDCGASRPGARTEVPEAPVGESEEARRIRDMAPGIIEGRPPHLTHYFNGFAGCM